MPEVKNNKTSNSETTETVKITKNGIVNVFERPINQQEKNDSKRNFKAFMKGVAYYSLFVLIVIILIGVLMSPQIAAGNLVYFVSSGISILFYSWVISFLFKKNNTVPFVLGTLIELILSILGNRSFLFLILIVLNGLFFIFYRQIKDQKS
jgi:hypothetical protein